MIPLTDLVISLAALLGAFVSGLSGFAFGLIVLGIWLHVLPPTVTGPLVLICGGFTTSMSLVAVWPAIRLTRVLPMILGGFLGIPAGIWLLTQLDPAVLRRSIGIFMIAYSLFMLLSPRLVLRHAGRAADAAIGFVGGAMSGSVGLSGAVPTAWSMLRGWRPDEARAVYQPFNLPILAASLA
ncbi:MAG: sulfite exporter TauE/SafE family protein, partial [Alphaproteobacteria bacterium]|nr:sulfite exporter TauE/SafE family protein [Alphaproteobacteria bacterium]